MAADNRRIAMAIVVIITVAPCIDSTGIVSP
jgi:hypothetical protein